MLLHTIVGFVLTDLWPFVLSTLLGTMLIFYLALVAGRQTAYIGQSLLHPLRFLVHQQALCPQCLGSAHGSGSESGLLMCDFCLREQTEQGAGERVPAGYIRRARLLRDWQWRSWTRKPVFFFPTARNPR